MGQIFDVFGIEWKILIVQIINFAILLGVLWYFLYTPLMTLIERRREQIIKGVADAERAEAALRDADAKKAEVLAEAALEAQDVLNKAREAAKKKEAEILKEAQEKYERILYEAEMKGEEIKRQALTESKEELARLIVLGVEKTVREKSL